MLKKDTHWISPSYEKTDFAFPLTLENKIEIFRDRIDGWQLNIAEQCLQIRHAGFGSLYICLSYFEMIARYHAADITSEKAGKFFRKGFRHFCAGHPLSKNPQLHIITQILYGGARCGLYHISTTTNKVYVSGEPKDSLTFEAATQRLIINPGILISEIRLNFAAYISKLQNPAEHELRQNFQIKFDHDILPQISP